MLATAGRARNQIRPSTIDTLEPDDIETGTIYVLESKSEHPFVAKHRKLIHKIGVTGGKVEIRVATAKDDATYLLAEVDVVATYKLAHLNRNKLEYLLHRVFAPAQLELTIEDRFGKPVKPREWFLVPLQAIDEAVSRIRDGSITDYTYDPKLAQLRPIEKYSLWSDSQSTLPHLRPGGRRAAKQIPKFLEERIKNCTATTDS